MISPAGSIAVLRYKLKANHNETIEEADSADAVLRYKLKANHNILQLSDN